MFGILGLVLVRVSRVGGLSPPLRALKALGLSVLPKPLANNQREDGGG